MFVPTRKINIGRVALTVASANPQKKFKVVAEIIVRVSNMGPQSDNLVWFHGIDSKYTKTDISSPLFSEQVII